MFGDDIIKQESLNEVLKVQSLAELEKARKESILESLIVLVDCSGSMGGSFVSGSETKEKAAQRAMNLLWEKTDWNICEMQVFSFNDTTMSIHCSESEKPALCQSSDGTSFTNALGSALSCQPTRIILTSDGQAEFPETQIAICVAKSIPIDTIFIQGSDDYNALGEALLRRISEETGGQFATVEDAEHLILAFAALETSERLALSYEPEEEENSVIKL